MDKRGFSIIFLSVFFTSLPLFADDYKILPTTEINDQPIAEIGTRQATRPSVSYGNDVLHVEERPEISEALNTLPGVQARIEGSPTINIRGSQSSARSLILEDDVPLNFSDGVGFNPLFISTENMNSITLLKGPSSALFGHDALAGVLEFNTNKLKGPKFFASEGSFNTQQAFAGAPFPIASSRFQITAYETHSDNNFSYRVPRTGATGTRIRDDSETTRMVLEGRSSDQRDPSHEFSWKTFNLFARQIGSTPGSLDFPYSAAFNNWGDIHSFQFQKAWEGHIVVGSRSSYKYLWQSYSNATPSATTSAREDLNLTYKFGWGSVSIFDEYTSEFFQAAYLPSQQKNYALNEAGASTYFIMNETLSGQAALRYSGENGGLLPGLGFIMNEADVKYFLNYSEGYRPASITQKYAVFTGFSGNPNVSPEHSAEVDLGFEKKYENILTHFEAFSRDFYNLIDNVVLTPGTFTPQNISHTRAYGFELSAETKSDFNAGGNLTYLSNIQVDTQMPVPLSPQFQVSAFLGRQWRQWELTCQGTYWGSQYDRDATSGQLVTLSDWFSLDLFANYEVNEHMKVRFAALDILDQPRELTLGYPEQQRTLTLSLMGYL